MFVGKLLLVIYNMGDNPKDRILDLYERAKGVKFEGIYRGTKDVDFNGTPMRQCLVEIRSSHMNSFMSQIIGCDRPPHDSVWKAVVIGEQDVTMLWSHDIEGVPVEGELTHFMITTVESKSGHNFNGRRYDAVINIKLKIIHENESLI